MRKYILSVVLVLLCLAVSAEEDNTPQVVHPAIGTFVKAGDITLTLTGKIQNLVCNAAKDSDIHSPKSVNFSPDGKFFFVNSLEGCRTPVYSSADMSKLYTISHRFTEADSALWAEDGMDFPFLESHQHPNVFRGKPVEGCFSHQGRYFWVPYYRRSYDENAQEPSALAVIDTRKKAVVRVFNTGVLPKMVACSNSGKLIAVTHWGDNTVGTIDCSATDPMLWRYKDLYVVDYRFVVDVQKGTKVNRDLGSGYALRGTVFTPDDKYLLVGCMGGTGGMAVIDLQQRKYLGRLTGMKPNLRHLLIHNNTLYLSINSSGHVQSLPLDSIITAASRFTPQVKKVETTGWRTAKVGAGARTICITPDGRYIIAACNFSSCLSVVDTKTMKEVGRIAADSFPVGMDISPDGTMLIATSQGRNEKGGNSVDIYTISRKPQ